MSLPILVAQEKWSDFDEAWTEQMNQDGPIDDLLTAIRLAGDKKRIARCVPLVRQHVELLEASDRHADAARLLGAALTAGAPASEVATPLMEHAEKAWGSEPWWSKHVEITGLSSGNDLRRPWQAFNKLRDFRKNTLIYHAGGWGTGEIIELREADSEILVRFESGRTDHFPMSGAVDIFEPLSEEDLRAQHFRDPEGLKKRLKKDHLEILQAVVSRYYGRATLASIKNALAQVSIEGSAWSAWWRKAKKLAENSEWFRISGNGQRMEVRLLLTAADPVEQLERQLRVLGSLAEITARTRDLHSDKNTTPELLEIALTRIEEECLDEAHPVAERLGAWMLLRELRGTTPAALLDWLNAAKAAPAPEDMTEAPELWKLFQAMPTSRDQERSIELLQEIFEGDDAWADEAVANLAFAPPGMVRVLIDKLRLAKRQADLADSYTTLIGRPLRAPYALIALARLAENGKLEGDYPPPATRAQCLLTLASHLWDVRRDDPQLTRAHTRLVDMLAGGRQSILMRLLENADAETMRSMQLLTQRGVEESIDNLVTALAFHAEPAGGQGRKVKGFWVGEEIWTTRTGLEKHRRELNELVNVKMPANEEAIGRAAAQGDLSENAEWEAAIEEKRNLSARAATMKEDERRAALLENAILPENTVCPGTKVRYMDLTAGKERTITLLGPWDATDDSKIVSYRAPLSQGMLGLHTGDRQKVNLPGGEIEIEVLEIEPIAVD